MKSHLLFEIVFVVLSIFGCGSPDNGWKEDSKRVKMEVRNTLNKYYEEINREGFLAEFKYLDSSSMFSWHPPGYQSAISFDSVKTILLQNVKRYTNVQLTWVTLAIFPESKMKANYMGKIKSILTDTTGKSTTYYLTEEGQMTKKEDGWKLVSGRTVMLGNY